MTIAHTYVYPVGPCIVVTRQHGASPGEVLVLCVPRCENVGWILQDKTARVVDVM